MRSAELAVLNADDAKVIELDANRPPEFTDLALKNRFVDIQRDQLRYVAALGRWFIWDGTRWKPDETLLARDLAAKSCARASADCNESKVAKNIASAKTVSAVERLAQADRAMAATIDQWDANPWLLNTPTVTVDLRSGGRAKHSRHDFITKVTSVGPEDIETPVWDGFLHRVTGGKVELIEFLQRMAGYSLTGDTREHALFFLYGTGANGKSTFVKALTDCAGDYHRVASIETFTGGTVDRHPTDLAGLRGARLVTAIETEEGRRWAESRIKALTGGDRISARFMRQDFFEYTPQFKLIIAGNHKPGLRSVDEAIRRRFNLIPFEVTIPPEERDETLPDKLRVEYPGILAWMIRGCSDWLERGLAAPAIVTNATTEYLTAEDAVAAWLDDCATTNPNVWEKSSDLFASWHQWATKSGEFVGSQKRFAQNLATRGFIAERKHGGRGFVGLRLNERPY